jgi:flagellar protein FlgJ
MSIPGVPKASYGDLETLASLKHADRRNTPEALRETARQFESLFTRMLLKTMRETTFDDSMQGQGESFYRDMFDDQLAIELSKGNGLGLADVLVEQLKRAGVVSEEVQQPDGGFGFDAASRAAAPSGRLATTAPTSSVPFRPASREDFVRELWPHAEAAGAELGVDPRTLIAHAALETGWGQHFPTDASGRSSLNLFGIKATGGWRGDSVGSRTLEFSGGVAEQRVEQFRAYHSAGESFRDYVALIRDNPRYGAAKGTGDDAVAFGRALQRGGYATDPEYAAKLARVATQVTPPPGADVLKITSHSPITPSEAPASGLAASDLEI